MFRHPHYSSLAKCLALVALFAGLYRYGRPVAAASPKTSALSRVLEVNDIPAACFLIRAGQDVSQEEICCTPLHLASLLGKVQVVRELLDAGGPVDVTDAQRQTPLFAAAALGHEDVAAELLSRGANPRQVDRQGKTPLHWAIASGCEEIAVLLLQAGADADARDATGQTPRALARDSVYPEMSLLMRRARPSANAASAR